MAETFEIKDDPCNDFELEKIESKHGHSTKQIVGLLIDNNICFKVNRTGDVFVPHDVLEPLDDRLSGDRVNPYMSKTE